MLHQVNKPKRPGDAHPCRRCDGCREEGGGCEGGYYGVCGETECGKMSVREMLWLCKNTKTFYYVEEVALTIIKLKRVIQNMNRQI